MLPMGPHLSLDEAEYVVTMIREYIFRVKKNKSPVAAENISYFEVKYASR